MTHTLEDSIHSSVYLATSCKIYHYISRSVYSFFYDAIAVHIARFVANPIDDTVGTVNYLVLKAARDTEIN